MTTTNYAWSLPIVGGNQNQWGTMLNTILTDIDAKMVSKTDAQTLTNKTLDAPVITGGASISGNVLVAGTLTAGNTSIGGRALDTWYSTRTVASIGSTAVSTLNHATTVGETLYNFYWNAAGAATAQNTGVSGYCSFNNQVTGGFAWALASSVAGGATPTLTQAMTLDASGNLLAGISSGTFHQLVKNNAGNWAAGVKNTSSTNPYGLLINHIGVTGGTGQFFLACSDDADRFRVLGNGNCQNQNNSYGAVSDPALKTNISLAKSQWDDVKQLARSVVKYNFKSDPNGFKQIGFLSRDHDGITGVRSISPGLVQANPDIEEYEVEPARTETKTTQKQKVTYSESVRYEVVEIEGKYTQLPIRTIVETPVFEVFPLFDEDGNPVLEIAEPAIEAQAEVLDDKGNLVTPAVAAKPAVYRQATHQAPVMEDVTETVEIPAVMGRRETGKSTDSVQYSIANMKAFKALGEALERIEALEAKVAALEARA